MKYSTYEEVTWFRREPGAIVLLFGLLFSPIFIALCVIALTGNVYKNSYDKKGQLAVWGIGNKIAAVLILTLQICGLVYYLNYNG